MACELCNKKTKNLFADCLFNEWLCTDCYSKYDWHTFEDAEQKHDKVWYRNIFNKLK